MSEIPEDRTPPPDDSEVFSDDEAIRFAEVHQHENDLWTESRRIAWSGFWPAVLLTILYCLGFFLVFIRRKTSRDPTQITVDNVLPHWTIYVSLDLASKILAVIATLVVAVAVVVRAIGDDQLNNADINLARHRALVSIGRYLAIGSVFIATVSACSAFGKDDWGIPTALALIFVSFVIATLSADASIQYGRERSKNHRYDLWRKEQESARLRETALRWEISASPTRRTKASGRSVSYIAILNALIGLAFTLWWIAISEDVFNRSSFGTTLRVSSIIIVVSVVCGIISVTLTFATIYCIQFRKWLVILFTSLLDLTWFGIITFYLIGSLFVEGSTAAVIVFNACWWAALTFGVAGLTLRNLTPKPPRSRQGLLLYDLRIVVNNDIERNLRKLDKRPRTHP